MMRQERCISISSTSTQASDDHDEHACSTLHRRTLEGCEFCDKTFRNKYLLLKHNVSHIIIPLIKQTTYQCDQCLYHFTSVEDLAKHATKKHDIKTTFNPFKLNIVGNINEKLPEILQSMVEKQVYVKCEDEFKEVFVKGNDLKRNGCIQNVGDLLKIPKQALNPKQESISLVKEELISPKKELMSPKVELVNPIRISPMGRNSPSEEEKESLRNKLLFEEDIEDDLFKDLTTDCQVNLESLCMDIDDLPIEILSDDDIEMPALDFNLTCSRLVSSFRRDIMFEDNIQVNGTQEDTTDLVPYSKAIHYDVLMEDEVSTCRWCGQDFPNRFKLLQHETKHIVIKQKHWRYPLCCVCERYISGNYHNLRKHMEKNHPDKVDLEITYSTYKCLKCNHQYHNYKKHLRYYHEYYKCHKCQIGFESPKVLKNHECSQKNIEHPTRLLQNIITNDMTRTNPDSFDSKLNPINSCQKMSSVMQLCAMCFSFMKIYMQNRQNYEVIGEKSELGVRQVCNKCNNLFFEVTLVKRRSLRNEASTNFKSKIKPLSNKERLKKIQTRLKMLQMRNKF